MSTSTDQHGTKPANARKRGSATPANTCKATGATDSAALQDAPCAPPTLAPSREQAHALYAAATRPADIRRLLRTDLFYLLLHGMGRTDMDDDFVFARVREVQHSPNGHLDLWAREHYKSTIITVGLTIFDILNDPEVTVGIFSHSRPIAKSFLRQIKREFEGNRLLQEHFPHIRPPHRRSGEAQRSWSENDGLVVERSANPKEATIEAWGLVDGQPIGRHFSLLIYDDVVTPESVTTPEMIQKTTDAWRVSLNLGARGGALRMIGTRYHAADTYAAILRQGSLIPRIHPATIDATPEGEPVFLPREALAAKLRDMGPYIFACQMLQDPLADRSMGFAREWFRRLPGPAPSPHGMNRYIMVDPASSKKAGSDYTAMWVVGLHEDGNYYVLDGVHDRLNLGERMEALFALHRAWQPLAVGYESYGMQADVEHLHYCMERQNYRFAVMTLGGQMAKNDRIRRLVPAFSQGRVYFPAHIFRKRSDGMVHDLVDEFFEQEYQAFPVAAHDDMFDCLSRIVDAGLGAVFPMPAGAAGGGMPRLAVQQADLFRKEE